MDQTQQVPQILNILPIIVILFLFYFMIIIPQKKQQKKQEEMLAALKKNDAVVTAGGMHGVIVNVKEKTVVLRVDDNTRIEVDKAAISYKV